MINKNKNLSWKAYEKSRKKADLERKRYKKTNG
jgi:hypothetical protein